MSVFASMMNHFMKRVICCNRGGGGEPEAPKAPDPAPTPSETSAQFFQSQIDALPGQLAAKQEFDPQFSQHQLEQLQQFGPQFAELGIGLEEQFGPRLAAATLESQRTLDPSRIAGSEAVAEFLEAGPDELSPDDLAQIQESVRAASATRGLSQSGFSADEEVNRIFGARQALKTRYLNTALAASGRLPGAGGNTVGGGGFTGTGQQFQGIDAGSFFGGQNSANQLAGSIFGTQGDIFGSQVQQQGNKMSMISDIIGGVAGGVGSYAGAGGMI